MKILYVTSFSTMLFKSSGSNMIKTFLEQKIEGTLLVCSEGFDFSQLAKWPPNILSTDIVKYEYLTKWLDENKNVIQKYLAG